MKIFGAVDYPQGSGPWWELRRGLVTASGCDRIITPKTMKFSAQAEDYIDELVGDLVNQSPNWFSEKGGKPPNMAIQEGVAREAESRRWFSMAYDVEVHEVGFCMADDGRSGFSPDGLIGTSYLDGRMIQAAEGLELKNPMLKTQARYLREGVLPSEYRCQVHAQMLFGDLRLVWFVSYSPPLPAFVIRVEPDKFTEALGEAVEQFHDKYAGARKRLGLPENVFSRVVSAAQPAKQETAVRRGDSYEPEPF